MVGGISRTVERDGWRFDIGGHRFFTKVRRGRGALARDPPRRGLPAPAPHEPHLLPAASSSTTRSRPCNALRNLGLIEAVRCVLSYLWVRVRPPKDQIDARGLDRRPLRLAPLPHFFKTYTEKVWGVPAVGDPGRLGARSGSRTCRSANACGEPSARCRSATRRSSHQPDRGVPVPEVRARDDVGALPRHWSRPRAPRSSCETPVTAHPPRGRPGRRGRRRDRRRRHRVPVRPRHLVDADHRAARGDGPAGARRGAAGGRRPQLPRLPHRRPRRARGRSPSTDNWIYIHAPEVKVGRIQNFGSWSPYMVKDGPHLPRPRVLRLRGRRAVDDRPTRTSSRWASASSRPSAWSRPSDVEAGYVVRMPKAYPDLRRRPTRPTSRSCGLAGASTRPTCTPSAATACTGTTTRTTRCSRPCSRSRTSCGADHDIWAVNVEEEYHEEKAAGPAGPGGTAQGRGTPAPGATPPSSPVAPGASARSLSRRRSSVALTRQRTA